MQEGSLESYLFYRHRRPGPGDPDVEDRERRTCILARDGYRLAASVFEPPEPRRAERSVVVASAIGVRREYYAPFARWLAARGARVVTFDYRGIGGSRPKRLASFDASLVDWGRLDLASVVRWAARELGDDRIALVGHSVGGQLVGLLPEPELVRAAVFVASQSGDYRLWPSRADRALLGALSYAVVPGVASALGYLPGSLGTGEDVPGGVARQWARWCRTPGYVIGGEGEARRDGYRRLRAPILAFDFDDDEFAPPAAVDALLALYENARVTRRRVPRSEASVGHFGFFRERFRSTLWQEAADFLQRSSCPVGVG